MASATEQESIESAVAQPTKIDPAAESLTGGPENIDETGDKPMADRQGEADQPVSSVENMDLDQPSTSTSIAAPGNPEGTDDAGKLGDPDTHMDSKGVDANVDGGHDLALDDNMSEYSNPDVDAKHRSRDAQASGDHPQHQHQNQHQQSSADGTRPKGRPPGAGAARSRAVVVDREKTAPFLIRVFFGLRHRRPDDYDRLDLLKEAEMHIWTWKDATLRELTSLISEKHPDCLASNHRISFKVVYPNLVRDGRYTFKDAGVVLNSSRPGFHRDDHGKTLDDLRFVVGDFIDVACAPAPTTAPFGAAGAAGALGSFRITGRAAAAAAGDDSLNGGIAGSNRGFRDRRYVPYSLAKGPRETDNEKARSLRSALDLVPHNEPRLSRAGGRPERPWDRERQRGDWPSRDGNRIGDQDRNGDRDRDRDREGNRERNQGRDRDRERNRERDLDREDRGGLGRRPDRSDGRRASDSAPSAHDDRDRRSWKRDGPQDRDGRRDDDRPHRDRRL
ncbi:Sin3 associated polypeptide p18-domain-containing protein [Polychytrium aggregatum]|uniref:Sin3 associated polypeptide p18-domain-containing protein n=1 Tax=Polychytrium aggregatum TaxID=110093 RepID=UPI0022FE218B|nr:Sin3 associated polypeptide p18-domain-containing protein [Polychytrium aggregatum]KAI9203048.1 Sin3 associated polypeptide p18-domain-containing protein [Polychytrium aggregatum]